MRMRKIGGMAVITGTAVALALGTASAAGATVAQPAAKPKAHKHVFTKRHQSFHHKDRVGRFHAQVDLRGHRSRQYSMPWAFVITNKKLRSIARGKATCAARGLNGRYHDRHVVPVGYTWHSTVRPHRAKKVYTLSGTCTFPVRVGHRPGVAYVGFSFRYAIDPRAKGVHAKHGKKSHVMRTSVKIKRR